MMPSRTHPPSPLRLARPGEAAPARQLGDLEIIEGVRAGRGDAAMALYQLVQPAIDATLTQVLGRADGYHDDLCQLALIRIVDSVVESSFAGRCNLKTWANVIASRLALDELRRRRRERSVLAPEESAGSTEVPAPASTNPERRLSERQDLSMLRAALGRLRPAQAEAVLLFDVLGHDLREVAELTGVSVAAAQSHVVRGRQELRRLLHRARQGADHV
jgi:RNA polymerase sigma-70 factor (ECF subfamily)